MTLTEFPHGISSFGVPVIGGGNLIPQTTGTYFFVDSATGLNAYDGKDKDHPLPTIDAAINKCTADKADVIIVMPGHAEDLANATTLIPDIDGITIVGLGNGRNRPVLTYTHANGNIPVTGTDISFRNIVFFSSITAVTSGMTVTGDGNSIIGCLWDFDAGSDDFVIMVDFDTADHCEAIGNKFIAENTGGCNEAIRIDDALDLTIAWNWIEGDYTTSAIAGDFAASTGMCIIHNFIRNSDTTAGKVIDAHDDSTGLIAYNSCGTLYSTNPESALDPGDCLCVENYVVNAVDESGTICPTTLSD